MKVNDWYGRRFSQWIEMRLRNHFKDEWMLNHPPSNFEYLVNYAQKHKFMCSKSEYVIANRLRALGLPMAHQAIFFNRFIVDLYLPGARTIIEIDGLYHDLESQKIKDNDRDAVFYEFGFDVHRWSSHLTDAALETKILAFRKAYSRFAKPYRLKPLVRPHSEEKATVEGLVKKALHLKKRGPVRITV